MDAYSLCGPRRHYITLTQHQVHVGTQLTNQNINAAQFMEFQYFPDGDPTAAVQPSSPPVYQIRFNSTSHADWGSHPMILHFELLDYPTSTANLETWLINGQIEYCLVESLRVPSAFHVEFVVSHQPMLVEYTFQ